MLTSDAAFALAFGGGGGALASDEAFALAFVTGNAMPLLLAVDVTSPSVKGCGGQRGCPLATMTTIALAQ